MSLHESPVEPRRVQAPPYPRLAPRAVDWNVLGLRVWQRARQLHPLVTYRILALAIALIIVTTDLHTDSSLRSDAWFVLLATCHIGLTALIAPRLARSSERANYSVIAADGLFCVALLATTYGWRGPFWIYAISAVFWPAFRFSLRGALVSVTLFDALVLLTNAGRIRETNNDGFGGDLLARLVMVYLVAGAIALTAQAMAQVTVLAAEAERSRIARDLHDGVGKTLGGISMEARSLAHWIERNPVEAGRRARYVARISEKAALDVRDVIRGLRETQASRQLFPAVRDVVDSWGRAHPGVSVQLQLNGQDAKVPVLIHGEVVRMLTELLRNVEHHAQADEVRVRVTLSSAGVTLAVRDDGVGFDTRRVDPWADDGHFGLLGGRERALTMGGRFRMASEPGSGTEVTLDLPLTAREERAVHLIR
jgi:signal transduction histidine kinase